MCVCAHECKCYQKPEDDVRSLRTGAAGSSSRLTWWVLERQPLSHEEQCVLSIPELPLQPLFYVYNLNPYLFF